MSEDPIHWTIICMTPSGFWESRDAYATCKAPKLRAQAAHYVAQALGVVAARWREILEAVENMVDHGDVLLRQGERLEDILFDDDAFTTSKRYFWAINFIHEADKLLDNSIQQWAQYKRHSVTPWKTGSRSGEPYWHEQSQKVLAAAEQEADKACEELRLLRQEFQERLERITIMRDGVSVPGPYFHSKRWFVTEEPPALQRQRRHGIPHLDPARRERQTAHLCQHLLSSTRPLRGKPASIPSFPFNTQFAHPHPPRQAIWSINESYSRTTLGLTTALVAAATYSVTLNLNNLARGLRKVWAPRRRRLIEQMMDPTCSAGWSALGARFVAFQRSDGGAGRVRKPSEWMIAVFLVRQVVVGAGRGVKARFGYLLGLKGRTGKGEGEGAA